MRNLRLRLLKVQEKNQLAEKMQIKQGVKDGQKKMLIEYYSIKTYYIYVRSLGQS